MFFFMIQYNEYDKKLITFIVSKRWNDYDSCISYWCFRSLRARDQRVERRDVNRPAHALQEPSHPHPL